MHRLRDLSHRATLVLLVASAGLIVPGLAGFGASLPLAAALLAVAAGFVALRERFAELPHVIGYDLGRYGRDLYLGPGVAVAVVLLDLGGTPAELQALGGVVGLAGMANYFVRPLYLFVVFRARKLLGADERRHGSGGPRQ